MRIHGTERIVEELMPVNAGRLAGRGTHNDICIVVQCPCDVYTLLLA